QHELVAFEDPDRARVGAEERRRVLDDFVQHRVRVELGGEQAAGARELLRERAGAPLRLVEVAAAERAARDVSELAGELEVAVGEAALLGEADEDDTVPLRAPRLERDGEERLATRVVGERRPLLSEARVIGE